MAANLAFDGGYNSTAGSEIGTTGNTTHRQLLQSFLDGAATGIKDQIASVASPKPEERTNIAQASQLAATEKESLASSFRQMLWSLSVADLEASTAYQHFKNRMNVEPTYASATNPEGKAVQPAIRTNETAVETQQQTQIAQENILPKIQEQLKKAGDIINAGDVEGGKAAYRQAIDMADKNYDAAKSTEEIRQLQNILTTNTFNGKTLTQDERMSVHNEILTRIAAAVLPYQLRSGSILKDQAGYATVLRQFEQNEAAEAAYKDAIKKADALPIAEMKKQLLLIADEMGRTNRDSDIKFLTAFSQNLLGGKDEQGNDLPGAIKLPITARKDLMEFYIRPTMQQDGAAKMSSPAKDGTPRFVADASQVFKPELALKMADEAAAKSKEILGIDLAKDPSKDAELQVFRATIDINLPDAIRKKREEVSYGWDSSVSNIAAMGVGILSTAILGRLGGRHLVAKAMPSLFKGGAAGGELTALGKTAEFVTAGTMATVTRNQMMTNYFDRKDESVMMSIANGFGSTLGGRMFYQAPKFLGDKVFLRGFSAEVATTRATTMAGGDGVAALAKLRELQPGLVIPKDVKTFADWASRVGPSERAAAISTMAKKIEPATWATKLNPVNKVNSIVGQPLRSAETLSAGGITARRFWAGALGGGSATTVMDAANNYSREWPRLFNGEFQNKDGSTKEVSFSSMFIEPIYRSPTDNSFVGGMIFGGLFAKPGAMLIKPWGDQFLSAGKRSSTVGKIWETTTTPIASSANVINGLVFSGSSWNYGLRTLTPGSDIGATLSNNLQLQAGNLFFNLTERELKGDYDRQLQMNLEALKDRPMPKRKPS